MSLLDLLSDEKTWNKFYDYKTSLISHSGFEKELHKFIQNKDYLPVCENLQSGRLFPLPVRSVINKNSYKKKRIVYTYPYAENMVLKLLTHLILRKYDYIFCDRLYSFRPARCAKDAIRRFVTDPTIKKSFFYKSDISNYFNSIPVERLVPMIKNVMHDDVPLAVFLTGLLEEKHVIYKGRIIEDEKGIMAGTPVASFYANLYLNELDNWFKDRNIAYARYSDDIIVFSENEELLCEYATQINKILSVSGLKMNPDKEFFGRPDDRWTFLGFSCCDRTIDIAPLTVKKIKAKMRRKSRALKRWQLRNGLDGEHSATAFIRIFNKKLLETPQDSELSWSCWFFPVINTADSLRGIDHYAQECIRFLISGKHTKARFNVRYEDLKQLGYRSLVHEYYNYPAATETTGKII